MISLYIHWPFCQSKCPYCDFNSHVRAQIDEEAWKEAYRHELRRLRKLVGPRQLKSIFFGGGTPSLMSPNLVDSLIQEVRSLWSSEQDLEITLEANPNSVEVNKFQALRAAGINRISIGIQALNNKDLKILGRLHDVAEAKQALTVAKNTFERVSFDLIYARPEQALKAWEQELEEALSYGCSHMSLYQLTIEPGTAFAPMHQRGELILPDETLAADFYDRTQAIMTSAGLPAYEISNHAKNGQESCHNLTYWRYQDYIGIGPGAHGRLTLGEKKVATKQYRAPETWLKAVQEQGNGDDQVIELTHKEQAQEAFIMGLRLHEGIHLTETLKNYVHASNLEHMLSAGFLEQRDERLKATSKGLLCLNAVLRQLLRYTDS